MATSGLQELFLQELSAVLSAQKDSAAQSAESADEAANPQLKRLFKIGSDINKKQVKRLEKIFASLKSDPDSVENFVIEGIDRANAVLRRNAAGSDERDLASISMAQAAVHYYISKYGALRAYAQTLGLGKAASLLGQSLDENKQGDRQFSKIAESILEDSYQAKFPSKGVGPVRSTLRLLAVAGLAAAVTRAVKQEPMVNAQ